MPVIYPVEQDEFLYSKRWPKEVDNVFIDLLMDQCSRCMFVPGKVDIVALGVCKDVLNAELDSSYTLNYCLDRLAVLQSRYRVFRWVLRHHGVRRCIASGLMTVPPNLWEHIFEQEPFSIAYQEVGHPRWEDLRVLFAGLYDIPDPRPHIVELSSSDEELTAKRLKRTHKLKTSHDIINLDSSSGGGKSPVAKKLILDIPGPSASGLSVNQFGQHSAISLSTRYSGNRSPRNLNRPTPKCYPSPCQGSNSAPPNV